jgi:CRISPR system Cascade subunit CasB
MKTNLHNFITSLEKLAEDKDRGALATLRRGLGQPPGTVSDMFRYVVPRLPENAYPGSWAERTHYLIASLFALHPESIVSGNLGDHFAEISRREKKKNPTGDDKEENKDTAIERRFTAILTAHPEDLHIYLRQAISFLKSKEEGAKGKVNWHQLMWDVLQLGNPDQAPLVQKRWATAFWRFQRTDEATPQPTN